MLALPIAGRAQYELYLQEDPEPTVQRQAGGAFSILESGSGLGGFYEWPLPNFTLIGGAFNIYMMRDSGQLEYVDPYTGYPVTYGKANNVYLLDFALTVKKRLFARAIDDQFRPYIGIGMGPVFGMNFPEDKSLSDQYRWAVSAAGAVGVDMVLDGNYLFGIKMQYRYMKFNDTLGEKQDHSTLDVRLELGKVL